MTTAENFIGQRVRVHLNLHAKRQGKPQWVLTQKGRVVAYAHDLAIGAVTFKISEKRRQAVIAARCREVHAYCEGIVLAAAPEGTRTPITYNPYAAPTFTVRATGAAVTACAAVHFTLSDGAVAVGAYT